MKQVWHVLMLAAVLTAGVRWGTGASPVSVDLRLSPAALEFDQGLDVRDAEGRRVAAPAARDQLRRLFVGGLYALLMRPDLPRVAEVLSVLEKMWNVSSGTVGHAVAAVWMACLDLWLPPVKRLNVTPFLCLLATLAVLLTQAAFGFFRTIPKTDSFLKSLSSIVLRR
ncbi:MAG TPA: hypothetical protein P5079_01220 [Elusimicrobiota bacterium]|nr:hypothetical protein [Elusimicrobiota bacterium]